MGGVNNHIKYLKPHLLKDQREITEGPCKFNSSIRLILLKSKIITLSNNHALFILLHTGNRRYDREPHGIQGKMNYTSTRDAWIVSIVLINITSVGYFLITTGQNREDSGQGGELSIH